MKGILIASFLLLLAAASLAAEPTREVSIIARQFEFLPNKIEVVKEKPVRVYLTSIDTDHGFYMEEFKIDQKIEKGKITVVDFIPNKEGIYEFKCSVVCGIGHRSMKGEIKVLGPMSEMPKMQGMKMQGMEEMHNMQHMH